MVGDSGHRSVSGNEGFCGGSCSGNEWLMTQEPSTERSVVTVTSPAGEEEAPMQEASRPRPQNQEAGHAEGKEEEAD